MRISSLDALRGYSALTVLLHHCILIFPRYHRPPINFWLSDFWSFDTVWFSIVKYTPIYLLFLGTKAVFIFFVISGFVISLNFIDGRQQAYPIFIIRRFARIYIPFAFAIAFAVLLMVIAAPAKLPKLTDWFNGSWNSQPNAQTISGHLLMLGDPYTDFDNVIWSLIIEMRVSIIFPAIVAAVVWNTRLTIIVACVLAPIGFIGDRLVSGELSSWCLTVQYLILFVAGSALAVHRIALKNWWLAQRAFRQKLFWIVAALLLMIPIANEWTFWFAGPAAIAVVALCYADVRAQYILNNPLLRWLGRVSYSLYLIHLPILLFFIHCLYGRIPLVPVIVMAITLSLLFAEIVNRLVERPAQLLGTMFSTMWENRRRKAVS